MLNFHLKLGGGGGEVKIFFLTVGVIFLTRKLFYSRDIVELLLHSGFYINLKTRAGSALHEAALCGKLDVVRTLLEHRIDLSICNDKGKTVLDLLQQFPTQISYDILKLIECKYVNFKIIVGGCFLQISIKTSFPQRFSNG